MQKNVRTFGFQLGIIIAALMQITCGSSPEEDCVDSCEFSKTCDGTDDSIDCKEFCSDIIKLSDDAGCDKQTEEIQSCAKDNQTCDTNSTACDSESDALTACILPYCEQEANQAQCTDVFAQFGS